MRTRRSILIGVGGLIALAGCSQQSSQPAEESDAEGVSGEFGIDQFRVGGENPDEYEAEFIAGSNASEVADELTPEVSYQISGASGAVETQVRYEYSDSTIPEDGPLDETVKGATHDGNGEYAQAPSMPDSLVSEVVENPKNIAVTFRATDTENEVTKTEEYELNLANSYIETAYRNIFNNQNMAVSDADLESVEPRSGTVTVSYESQYQIGSQEFNSELANVVGGYSESVERTRIPYNLELSVSDSNDDVYERSVSNNNAQRHLDGEISESQLGREILFDEILSD